MINVFNGYYIQYNYLQKVYKKCKISLGKGDKKLFEELKTFVAVVEYKNFTKAGEYLNLSQPSVSKDIKNL